MSGPGKVTVTYVRTCTTIISSGGKNILTDPWFSMRMRFLPALKKPGVPLAAVPRPDLVLCSHLHADHFDRPALKTLAGPGTAIAGPMGTAAAVASGTGGVVEEMAPGDRLEAHGMTVTAYPMLHTFPPPDELGFLVETGEYSLFFAGDAAYSPVFAEIGRTTTIDVALLPVGGTLIFGRRTVMDPAQALQAALDLKARVVIPTHPGGDWLPVPPLSLHPGSPEELEELARKQVDPPQVLTLAPGQTAVVERDSETGRAGGRRVPQI